MAKIWPNDIVKHIPTGEEWVVCGVNHEKGKLIPCGYPFPSMADVSDCELVESHYVANPQTLEQIAALKKHGLDNYIDVRSAMFHGMI